MTKLLLHVFNFELWCGIFDFFTLEKMISMHPHPLHLQVPPPDIFILGLPSNSITPRSDQHVTSPFDVYMFSSKQLMRKLKLIGRSFYLDLTPNSHNSFQGIVLQQEERINNQILGVKGLNKIKIEINFI